MKTAKSIIPVLLIFILIFSTVGTAFADNNTTRTLDPKTLFSGYITVEFNQTTAHVNDTVLITVTANNNGLVDWSPLKVYAPIPNGLKYLSHIIPDRVRQDYDPGTGIWDVNRMRSDERGLLKTLVIVVKVKPEAAGKTLTATARFNTLVLEGYGVHMENTEYIADARPAKLTVFSANNNGNGNGKGNGTGNGTGNGKGSGSGNGTGNGTGNGNDLINNLGNSKLASALGNLTQSEKDNPLANLQTGGGGENGKKVYEITKDPQQTQDNSIAMYILAILLIIGLLAAGYFYGIKREE